MRILFVGLPSNIHLARWISQLCDLNWDIHLVPTDRQPLHPDLVGKVSLHREAPSIRVGTKLAIKLLQRWPHHRGSGHARRLMQRLQSQTSLVGLAQIIQRVSPDIVHSLIIHTSGIPTLQAQRALGAQFPPWIVSIWGSDVQFWGTLSAYRERTKEVLSACDYVATECERDVWAARQFGFVGHALPVIPAAGGYHIDKCQSLRQPGPTSDRRVILLKGYQHTVGRALVGLRAIELCADLLQEYQVFVQLASPDVKLAAEFISNRTGIPIETTPLVPHPIYPEILRRYGRARIHIGLSITDGIAQSLLESMVMGAFPIQSCTACADEWIVDGKSGLIVPPEDPHVVADAIRLAVTDDDLVDRGAEINNKTVRERLDYKEVRERVINMYESVYYSFSPARRTQDQ